MQDKFSPAIATGRSSSRADLCQAYSSLTENWFRVPGSHRFSDDCFAQMKLTKSTVQECGVKRIQILSPR